MLPLRLLIATCTILGVVRVCSRPTGSDKDWEVGRSPISGLEGAGPWNDAAPWSSDESTPGPSERPSSPGTWSNTWFGSPSVPARGIFATSDTARDGIAHPDPFVLTVPNRGLYDVASPPPPQVGHFQPLHATMPDHGIYGPAQSTPSTIDPPQALFPARLDHRIHDASQQPAWNLLDRVQNPAPQIFDRNLYGVSSLPYDRSQHVNADQPSVPVRIASTESSDPSLNHVQTTLRGPSFPHVYTGQAGPLQQEASSSSQLGGSARFPLHVMESSGLAPGSWFHSDLAGSELGDLRRMARSPFHGIREHEELWKQRLRKALGRERLRVSLAWLPSNLDDRVYVAEDGHPFDASRSSDTSSWERGPYYGPGGGRGHFLMGNNMLRTEPLQNVPKGDRDRRIFVYLNSGINMDHLNEKYFLNQLRFLPINTQELTWGGLNRLHLGRQVQYVLPPVAENGMALIVDRHDGPKGSPSAFLSKLTGQMHVGQSISLWSPIMFDGERHTVVLYGVAQVNLARAEEVVRNLEAMQKHATSSKTEYSPTYDLANVIKDFRP